MKLLAPLVALGLLLASATVGWAQAGQSFSLRPASAEADNPAGGAYFVYAIASGATKSDEVLVLNTGDEPATLDLYAVDALTGATTGAVYANQGTQATAAGTWIRLPQARVTVPPQSTTRVPFDVNVPAGTKSGQFLAGLVAQPAAGASAQPSGQAVSKSGQFTVTTTTRVVVAVAVTVPGLLERKIVITGVRATTAAGGTQLAVGIRNDGNVLVKPKGRLVLRDASGAERLQVAVDMDTILPGGSAEHTVPWPRELPAGDYSAEVVLDTTDALPGTAPAVAAPAPAVGGTAVAQPGHAEFRSQPIPVKPAASPIRPPPRLVTPARLLRPAPARPAPGSEGSWLPLAIAALATLLIANAAVAFYVLRRRAGSNAGFGPAPAPAGSNAGFGLPPAPAGAAFTRPSPTVRPAPAPLPATPPSSGAGGEAAFVKGRGRTVYLLQAGVRRPFASWSAFISRGGSPTLANVRLLPEDALAAIPEGAPIEDEAQSA